MSRIDICDEPSDDLAWFRWEGFVSNMERHIKGRKGQALLRELEAAILALPWDLTRKAQSILGVKEVFAYAVMHMAR